MSTVETLPPGVESVLDELLKLTPAQRLLVADRLIESVPPPPLGPEWEAEIARRVAEIESGTAQLVPWEQVRTELQEIVDEASQAESRRPNRTP